MLFSMLMDYVHELLDRSSYSRLTFQNKDVLHLAAGATKCRHGEINSYVKHVYNILSAYCMRTPCPNPYKHFAHFWDIGKECRPSSDAAERGV